MKARIEHFFQPGRLTTITGGASWQYLFHLMAQGVAYKKYHPALYMYNGEKPDLRMFPLRLMPQMQDNMIIMPMVDKMNQNFLEWLDNSIEFLGLRYVFLRWQPDDDFPAHVLNDYARLHHINIIVHTSTCCLSRDKPNVEQAWVNGAMGLSQMPGGIVQGYDRQRPRDRFTFEWSPPKSV